MRLDLRNVIHVPGAVLPFEFQLDLSNREFYGQKPISQPILAKGEIRNRAGAMTLTGTATTILDLHCDRCYQEFTREHVATIDFLLADRLEDEENDEIILLDGTELDLEEVVSTTFILSLDTKNLCSDDCKGLCATCGADLNEGPCGCKTPVDPRLAALAQLLDDVTE